MNSTDILLAFPFVVLAGCGPSNHPVEPISPGGDAGTDAVMNGITDVTLPPPATPELRWQFDIPAFSVNPGAEVQQCFFFQVPYDTPVFVNHVEMAQTTGTHYMNIFCVRTRLNLDPDKANY